MDKSVIIFVLLAVAFTAAVVGGLLFVYARRLPAAVSAARLSAIARLIDGRVSSKGEYIGEYDQRGARIQLTSSGEQAQMHIYLEPVRGGNGWRLSKAGDDFHLDADPPALSDALISGGLEQYLGPLRDQPDLALDYQPTTLHCTYRLPNAYAVPDPDAFGDQLRALGTIAHLSEQVISDKSGLGNRYVRPGYFPRTGYGPLPQRSPSAGGATADSG